MTTRRMGGREAVTHYQARRKLDTVFGKFTLLELKIDTGRTHQIRVHLASLGHPVVRSEEHTSELQSLTNLVCRLLLEKKNTKHPPAFCTGSSITAATVSGPSTRIRSSIWSAAQIGSRSSGQLY